MLWGDAIDWVRMSKPSPVCHFQVASQMSAGLKVAEDGPRPHTQLFLFWDLGGEITSKLTKKKKFIRLLSNQTVPVFSCKGLRNSIVFSNGIHVG